MASSSNQATKTISLNVSKCPIEKVVVYQPGARITRSLKFEPTETGTHKIVVEGISAHCDSNSLSIDGTGGCRIEDVTTETIKKRRQEVKSEYTDATKNEINQLIEELKGFVDEEHKINQRITLNDQKKDLLKAHVTSQLTNTPKDGFTQFQLPDSETALSLLDVYSKTSEGIEDEKRQLTIQLQDLEPKRMVVIDRLVRLLGNIWIPRDSGETALQRVIVEYKNYETIDVTVACVELEVLNIDSPIHLEMTYQVDSARWFASYDVRSHDEVADVHMLGNVSQWSGEDWNDVSLSLSSANLQEEKTPPMLPPQTVGFKVPSGETRPMMRRRKMKAMATPGVGSGLFGMTARDASESLLDSSMDFSAVEEVEYAATTVEGAGISTSYAIERKTTIAADSESHKVTIATLQLPCELFRYAIPSLSNSVFIQAKLKNLSDYQFLDSNQVSVYLDGSFVGRTSLSKRVAPTETCFISIGSDPSISMTYIPPRPFTKESGLISKTRQQTYEATTYLTPSNLPVSSTGQNTSIAIVSSLPSSTDAKITVKLVEPDSCSEIDYPNDIEAAVQALELSRGRRASYINNSNNHVIDILPLTTSKVCIKMKYMIDWPSDKKIEIVKQNN